MPSYRTTCSVATHQEYKSSLEGAVIVTVTGQLVNNIGRRMLNRTVDELAPGRYKTNTEVVYIFDLREVNDIDDNGYEALRYVKKRLALCLATKCCFCVDTNQPAFDGWGQKDIARHTPWFESVVSAISWYNNQ